MIAIKQRPTNKSDAEEYINACLNELDRIEEDNEHAIQIAIASGIITAITLATAYITAISAFIVAALASGVVCIVSIIDIISNILDKNTAKKNIIICKAAI